MPPRLVLCASCDRHVLASETRCPFCRFVMGVMTASAGLALLGCPDKSMKADTDASAPASASASASASAPASASASASPSASAAVDPFDAGQGIGLGDLRVGAGVYGPASNNTAGSRGLGSIGLKRGMCEVTQTKATVPIDDADRVLASLRPRFRASYNNALERDSSLAGTLAFTANIAANGEVISADGKGNGLGDALDKTLVEIIKRAQFAPPGKPSVLSGTITCKPSS